MDKILLPDSVLPEIASVFCCICKQHSDPLSRTVTFPPVQSRSLMYDYVDLTKQGIMESLEFLLESGFTPRRSFFLALGHDEEGSGFEGAQEMAKILTNRLSGQELLYILDEGTFILKPGSFPGIRQSVAMCVTLSPDIVWHLRDTHTYSCTPS